MKRVSQSYNQIDLNFDCPLCGWNLDVDSKGMGMKVPCPHCGQTIQIPVVELTPHRIHVKPVPPVLEEKPATRPVLSNKSPDGKKKRCAFCRSYMDIEMLVCPSCGFNHATGRRHQTVFRTRRTVSLSWQHIISVVLVGAFVYCVFISERGPEIPRTKKLLQILWSKTLERPDRH